MTAFYDFFRNIKLYSTDGTTLEATLEADSVTDSLNISRGNGVAFTGANASTDSFKIDVDYDLNVPVATTTLRLSDVNSNNKDIALVAGGNMTITRDSANQLTIAALIGGVSKSISAITQANPARVTTTNAHDFTEGTPVTIVDVVGMTNVNGNEYYMNIIDSTNFDLYTDENLTVTLDSTGFGAYTSGGVATADYGGAKQVFKTIAVSGQTDIVADTITDTLNITGGTGIDITTTPATDTIAWAIDSSVVTLNDSQTLTNKTLTTPIISSISNTGTITLPTSTDTLVGKATTDTLTNKTIATASNTITVVEADISDFGSYLPLGGGTMTAPLNITATGPTNQLVLTDANTSTTQAGPTLELYRTRTGFVLGQENMGGAIKFNINDNAGNTETVASLFSHSINMTDGSESGALRIELMTVGAVETAYQLNTSQFMFYPGNSGNKYFQWKDHSGAGTYFRLKSPSTAISGTTTITLPGATDTLVGKATTDTLTNKSISLTTNTVTGTLAEFNTAVSDATLVSTAGTETLTNKTLTDPILSPTATTAGKVEFLEGTNNGTNKATLIGPASTANVTITLPAATDTLIGRATTDTLTNKTLTDPVLAPTATTGGKIEFLEGTNNGTHKITLQAPASVTGARTITFPDGGGTVPVSVSSPLSLSGLTGDISLGTVPISKGGTGATTAATARTALTLNTDDDVQFDSLGVGTAASGTAGEIRATNNITGYYSSDRRLKENITNIPNALDKVTQLNGVTFDWTDEHIKERGGEDGYFVKKHDTGLIAQDVQQVLPEIVRNKQDGYLGVQYDKVVGLLVEAIKELKHEVEFLKGKR